MFWCKCRLCGVNPVSLLRGADRSALGDKHPVERIRSRLDTSQLKPTLFMANIVGSGHGGDKGELGSSGTGGDREALGVGPPTEDYLAGRGMVSPDMPVVGNSW